MAKDKSKKASTKTVETVEKKDVEPVLEPEPLEPPPNTIRICATSYQNITTVFPVADLTLKIEFQGKLLFESPKTNVLRNDYIPTDFEITLPCNFNDNKDVDRFITSPLVVTVIETEREVDLTDLQVATPAEKEPVPTETGSSSLSKEKKSKGSSEKKSKKGGKDKKKKKSDKKSKSSSSKTASIVALGPPKPVGPITVGMAKLDLLPLFLGKVEFVESLYIEHVPPVFDETATAIENLLKVEMFIQLEGPVVQPDSHTILHISVESLYNIPGFIIEDFQYDLCCLLPGQSLKLEPLRFNKGKCVAEYRKFQYKFYPKAAETDTPVASTYRLPDDVSDVRNEVEVDLDPVVFGEAPKIEWNTIVRQFITNDCLSNLFWQIRKYRRIPIEIYITPLQEEPEIQVSKKKSIGKSKSKEKSDKSKSKTSTNTSSKTEALPKEMDTSVDYLHLMAIVDVGYLLYPGITKCRVACPLNTYQEKEILEQAGLEDSFFRPRPPPPPPQPIQLPKKAGKGKGKGGKGSKGSKSAKSSKSSKSSKGKKGKGKGKGKEKAAPPEGKNLAEYLPPPPPPEPEPSKQVYNDYGQPAFIIVELELLKPLSPKRDMDELDEEMEKIIPTRPELPKQFLSSRLAEEMYYETIRCLLYDMDGQYKSYTEEKNQCKCEVIQTFLEHLQQTGAYQTYLTTIIRSLTTLVPAKFDFDKNTIKSGLEYQLFVADVFVDSIQQMNRVINENMVCNVNSQEHKHPIPTEGMLLFAKEALELGEQTSAERYFLERICCREECADYWFDYAVYLMEIGAHEKAVECLTEVLSLDNLHKYGLLMYGLLQSDIGKNMEAESCLLRVVFAHPRWAEGWGALHSFYKRTGNYEGTDFAWDMAQSYIADLNEISDYFSTNDDLCWSSEKCKDDVLLRTAVLMIKMRLYEHAERVLACALLHFKGQTKYMLGVMAYLKKEYKHALDHLRKAERSSGLDYGICSLIGHCYIKLNDHEMALKYFEIVLSMFDRPEDIHLVFLNAGIAYDVDGDSQKARKLALMACKYSPTPQTWLFAGGFYYKQNDILSAEECLIQANLCDNRLAEPWAYLALINAQMDRFHKADLCLTQAKKYNLEKKRLIKHIEELVKSYLKDM